MAISAQEIRRLRSEEEHARRTTPRSPFAPMAEPVVIEEEEEPAPFPFHKQPTTSGEVITKSGAAEILKKAEQQPTRDQAVSMADAGLEGGVIPTSAGDLRMEPKQPGPIDMPTPVRIRNAQAATREATEQEMVNSEWNQPRKPGPKPEASPAPMPAPQATATDPETGKEIPVVGPRAPETRPGMQEPSAKPSAAGLKTVDSMTGGQLIDAANNAKLSDLSATGAAAVTPAVTKGTTGENDEAYQQWLDANRPNKYNPKPTGQFRMYDTGLDAEGNEVIPGKSGYDLWLEDNLELDMTDGFSPEENNAWDSINNSMRKPGGKSMDEVLNDRHLMDRTADERANNKIPDVDASQLTSPDMSSNESARTAYIEQLREKHRRMGHVMMDPETGKPVLDENGQTILDPKYMPTNLGELNVDSWMHGTGTTKAGGNTVFNPLGGRDGRGSTARRGWIEDAFSKGVLDNYMSQDGWAQLGPQDRRDLVAYYANQMGWVDPETGKPIDPNSSQQEYYRAKRAVFASKMQTAKTRKDRAWLDSEAQLGENLEVQQGDGVGLDMPYYENVLNDNTGEMELQIPLDRRKDQERRRQAAFFAKGLKGHSRMPIMTDEDGQYDEGAARAYIAQRMGLDPDSLTVDDERHIEWGMNNLRDAQQHLNVRQQLMDRGQGQLSMNHEGDSGDWLQAGAYNRELEEAGGDLEQMAMIARKYNNTDDLNTFLEQMTGQAEAADDQAKKTADFQGKLFERQTNLSEIEARGDGERKLAEDKAARETAEIRNQSWVAAHATQDPQAVAAWYQTHVPIIMTELRTENPGTLPTYEQFQSKSPSNFLDNFATDQVSMGDPRGMFGWMLDVIKGDTENPLLDDLEAYQSRKMAYIEGVLRTLGMNNEDQEALDAAGWYHAINQSFNRLWENNGGTPFWEDQQPNTNGKPPAGPEDEITEGPAPQAQAPVSKTAFPIGL